MELHLKKLASVAKGEEPETCQVVNSWAASKSWVRFCLRDVRLSFVPHLWSLPFLEFLTRGHSYAARVRCAQSLITGALVRWTAGPRARRRPPSLGVCLALSDKRRALAPSLFVRVLAGNPSEQPSREYYY